MAFPVVLQGLVFSWNPIRKRVLLFSNARDRVKITLYNDIISRAAIKQINCHAHRAKISIYPLFPGSLLKMELPESQLVDPYLPLVLSAWQVCSMDIPPKRRGLKQPWCLVYRYRYVNKFYTIKSFLKNKWSESICDISFFLVLLCIQGFLSWSFQSFLCSPWNLQLYVHGLLYLRYPGKFSKAPTLRPTYPAE